MAAPLLERDPAMAELRAAMAEVGTGTGAIVIIEGPAGIGKTSLLRAFLEETSVRTMVGWCDNLSIPEALGPFLDIAREDPRLLEAHGTDAATFRRAVLTSLDEAATVLAIEDIQWADQATLDTIAHLARRLHNVSALMVVTLRSGLPMDHAVLRVLEQMPGDLVTRVALTELSFEAVAALAHARGRDPVVVYELTDGNPFLVSEILATGDAVPGTISDSVSARISSLQPPAGETAAVLSVIPGEVEWELAETLLPDAATALADLELEGMVVSSANGIAFRHELLRRVVEERLTAAERRRINKHVLNSLLAESVSGSRVAHHAAEAGDIDVLLEHSMVAAAQAAKAGAHTQALAHIMSVLPHTERLGLRSQAEVWETASREHWFNQNDSESLDAIERAIELWERLGEVERLASALSHAARVEWILSRPDRTEELRRRQIALLESVPASDALTDAYVSYGQDLGLSSRIDEALVWVNRAVALAESNDDLARAKALGAREILRMATGDAIAARSDGDRAIEIFRALNAQDALSVTYTNRIAAAINVVHLDHVDEDVHAAHEYAAEIDSRVLDTRLAMHVGRLHLLRGDWAAAAEAADLVLEMNPEGVRRSTALTVKALLLGRRGEPGADETLDEAIHLVTPTNDIQRVGNVAVAAAELTWLGLVDAVEFLGRAHRLAGQSHYVRYLAETALWLRRLGGDAVHDGAAPEPLARELAGEHLAAAEAWDRLGLPYQRALALAFSGDLSSMREAFDLMDGLGATAGRDRVHQMMRERGATLGRRRTAATRSNPAGLTNRQLDVLALLTEELTNAEIADRLFVSAKTVDHHVSAILAKLEVSTRSEAVVRFSELLADKPPTRGSAAEK